MKKISLVVLPAITIALEILPLGAVCIFAPSPTERVKETFSYFSTIPFWLCKFCPTYYSCTYCCYLVTVVDFIKEKWSFQFYVCSFNYYSSYFSFAVGVWIELFHLCGSLNNDGTCNRMHFD